MTRRSIASVGARAFAQKGVTAGAKVSKRDLCAVRQRTGHASEHLHRRTGPTAKRLSLRALHPLFFATLTLLGLIAWSAVAFIGHRTGRSADELIAGPAAMLLHGGLMLVTAVGVGWFCGRAFEGLSFGALGWTSARGWWRDLLCGVAVGAGLFLSLPSSRGRSRAYVSR